MSLSDTALFDWLADGRPDGPVATHVAGCPACVAALDELEGLLADVSLALAPVAPSKGGLGRLLAAAREDQVPAVAAHFDLPVGRARALLDQLDDERAWVAGKYDMRLLHFSGGPALAGADCGFARLMPGGGLPPHRHPGDERVLVLQGRLSAADGRSWGPGDTGVFGAGEEHAFRAAGPAELVLAVVKVKGS